ncbi:hypothetical protein BGZ65_005315 [Modicella reniformis]|uniref:Crinkler effector protein N-terminal domain-containing protein n=1 Tax=Modicella reniformis TaxID=1440133 RepID=A0A9P6ST62_9FUNG|nr:hypothetical protein BGZ65_005315 [Modicella reniformis]
MANEWTIWCVVNGESTSATFSVKAKSMESVDGLKKAIKREKSNVFANVDADQLALWKVSIEWNPAIVIKLDQLDQPLKAKLDNPRTLLSLLFPQGPGDNDCIIVELPQSALKRGREGDADQHLPKKKKIHIEEGWKPFMASDGVSVDLPPYWIDILESNNLTPAPRTQFNHLKGDLQAGMALDIPKFGQAPKEYSINFKFFVTEQMLEIWNEMQNGVAGDEHRIFRRVLAGPMGVGKSYLSYFLVARAYAEGWPLLYLADAEELDKSMEDEVAMFVVGIFLAQNKDILTAAELESLVRDYDGTHKLPLYGISVILGKILKQTERKTLLVVDEHRKLFRNKPYVPDKFKSLKPLADFHVWPEDRIGAHVIFTGTAHAKYELEILEDSYKQRSLVFVGPLSEAVFLQLMATYPDLNQPACREAVRTITNCVPRELVQLSKFIGQSPPAEAIRQYESLRIKQFLQVAEVYYRSLDVEYYRTKFFKALIECFLGGTMNTDFQWNFLDLGMVYRRKRPGDNFPTFYMLCPPAQKALLELFKSMPLPEELRKCLDIGTKLTGEHFEQILFHQLLRNPKPILLTATDLNNKNQQTISLDFDEWDTIKPGDISLGPDYKKTLSRGYEGYPRFDYMLGPIFIQASVEEGKPNQIETYLDHMYGPSHTAKIDEVSKRFVVTKNGERVPGFRIVYVQGTSGAPAHKGLVKNLPDVAHVSFEEIKEKLFKNL